MFLSDSKRNGTKEKEKNKRLPLETLKKFLSTTTV